MDWLLIYKTNKIVLFCFLLFYSCSKVNELKLDKNKTYLVFRDSESKEGFFVKKFNISNTDVTHVGFLFFNNQTWKVYHAIDVKDKNCVVVEDYNNFSIKNDKELKIRILEIKDFDKKELLNNKLDSIYKLNLKFDFTFSENKANSTYCSKFVCDLLNSVDSKYQFRLTTKPLNNLESSYLKKDTLNYYPVDLFFKDEKFKIVQ